MLNRRWIGSPLLALTISTSALAQAPATCPPVAQAATAEQVQAGQRDARDRGFLWRISKSGHDSYLYGTVHVAKFEWMFPGPTVNRALHASDTIALELDMLDPAVQLGMARGMAAPAGTPPLPAPLQQRLDAQTRAACIPAQALAGLIPEMQLAALAALVGRRDGLDPAYGIDTFLAGWGHSARKTMISLETPELQFKALRMTSEADMLEFVASTLDDLESGRAAPALKRVAQVWADSNADALTHYETWCNCLETPADRAGMARMLDERNPALADRIAALHASGARVFAAVGSLHMTGPLGLPALMAQRGFAVEAITLPARQARQ